ncbi:MAG: plastocyanin/azurin family copper-binding protein [Nitrososphaeraceae archaeon]
MTTEDENHQSIIRTSPRRLAKGVAILVVVMAVGAAIAVPNWTNMTKYPPLVSTIKTEPSPSGVSEGGGLPAAEETQTPVPAGAMKITMLEGASVQGNPDYDPDDAQVPLNTKVVWENADSVPHTATSGSGPEDANSGKIFDTGIVNNGESSAPLELTGAAEGDKIAYYCQVHPYMTSSLTVTAASAAGSAAAPAAGGAETAGASLSILEGASVQGNPAYDPDPLTVTAGDVIEVSNNDNVPHTATSGSGPEDPKSGSQFDTSIIDAGATAQIDTANLAAGDYPFYCSVHPYMLGNLKVS